MTLLILCGLVAWVACGCGGSAENRPAEAGPPTSCTPGRSAAALVPDAPAWWTEGKGPTLALACLHDHATGDAMILGYASPTTTGGHCVGAYNFRLHWSIGEKCAAPGVPWTYWCEGAEGCIKGFGYDEGTTGLMGLLSARVKNVRVLVGGKPLRAGVAFANVQGGTIRKVGAEEPFAFFLAFIPHCANPKQVKVVLLDFSGAPMGVARPWTSSVRCPGRS